MASWSVLAAVDGLLLRGCVVACETDRSAQAKGVEYLTRFVHTLPLADTPLASPRTCLPTLPSISKSRIRNTRDCRLSLSPCPTLYEVGCGVTLRVGRVVA